MSKQKLSQYHSQIVEMAKTKSLSEICKILKLASSSLSGYVKENKIEIINKPKDISQFLPEVIELASSGMSTKHIAEKLCISQSSLWYQIKKNNITVRNGKFLEENKDEEIAVISLHKQGMTYNEIAKELGIPSKRIPKYLDKNGVKKRTVVESFRMKMKLNEDCFGDFSSAESQYWFGWLVTDGCLTTRNTISLSLKASDKIVIEKLKEFFRADAAIFETTYLHKQIDKLVSTCSITVGSKKIADSLRSQNMFERKSCNEKLPNFDWLDGENAHHFWRACVEGDGCISRLQGKNKIDVKISLVGSSELLTGFREYSEKHCGVKPGKMLRSRNYGDPNFRLLDYCCHDAYLICKKLYENSGELFLPRKKERADAIVAYYERNK